MAVPWSYSGTLRRICSYVGRNYWELPASILEGATLVLVVFFQDIAFKEIIVTCAFLLTASFCLHGLAYRAGQTQSWPKVIELVAPFLFYGLIPAAYLTTQMTYKTVFITINYWFIFWQSLFWLGLGRNFMAEYLQDWNPREVWGTPLIKHCAKAVALSWITCEAIMGSVQIIVVIYNISLDTNPAAAIMLCYIMQLLPLLWAIVFTFAYPAYIKRRWGYKYGVRESCYPGSTTAAAAMVPATASVSNFSDTGNLSSSCSGASVDAEFKVVIHDVGSSSSSNLKDVL